MTFTYHIPSTIDTDFEIFKRNVEGDLKKSFNYFKNSYLFSLRDIAVTLCNDIISLKIEFVLSKNDDKVVKQALLNLELCMMYIADNINTYLIEDMYHYDVKQYVYGDNIALLINRKLWTYDGNNFKLLARNVDFVRVVDDSLKYSSQQFTSGVETCKQNTTK